MQLELVLVVRDTVEEMAMPISVGEVVVGRCYETETGQQRRVWAIRQGKVYYWSRGGNQPWQPGHTLASPPTLKSFAQAVDVVITCPTLALPAIPPLDNLPASEVFDVVDASVDTALKNGDDLLLLDADLWEALLSELGVKPEVEGNEEELRYRGVCLRQSVVH